jgi:hypothetical protein
MSSRGLAIPVPNDMDDLPLAKTAKGKTKASNAKPPLFAGPKVVLHNQVWSENWVLVTHGRAYTQLHHDAAGLATYVIVNCGAKIWVPSGPPPSTSITTRQELFDAFDLLFLKGCKRPDLERSGGSILLEPGDVLYMFIVTIIFESHKRLVDFSRLGSSTKSTPLSNQSPREGISSHIAPCI